MPLPFIPKPEHCRVIVRLYAQGVPSRRIPARSSRPQRLPLPTPTTPDSLPLSPSLINQFPFVADGAIGEIRFSWRDATLPPRARSIDVPTSRSIEQLRNHAVHANYALRTPGRFVYSLISALPTPIKAIDKV